MISGLIILITMFLIGYYILWQKVSRFESFDFQPDQPRPGLVLGAALRGEEPSPALKERLDYALTLYRQGWLTEVICSGGGDYQHVSEAQVMRAYLGNNGIPTTAIVTEVHSMNTLENLSQTNRLLKKRKLDPDVYLITHDYHMFRALQSAERAGVTALPAPFASKHLRMFYHKTRECMALIKFFLLSSTKV
ncbi:YdcF family protein [Marininema halotolerans]|uniref:DUF218 domain-containing protein n=1 Tax=Marininema halotolerans TaxID=1155944 RepID=A0A1I6SLG7_9BACL|nr:YdcF family protein [Marininema halotolerans]SFS77618.1 DUF218 domain-containing protein [Marininema halotolerans]